MLVSYGTDFGKHSRRSSQRSFLGLKILCLGKSIHSMYKVPLWEKRVYFPNRGGCQKEKKER